MDDDFTAKAIANSQRRFENSSTDSAQYPSGRGFGLGRRRSFDSSHDFEDSSWYGYEAEPKGRRRRPSTYPDQDYTYVKTDHLSEEDKNQLLQDLLNQHNEHTKTQRQLEIEHDRVTLDNRKRFSNLGYHLMTWGAIGLGSSFMCLVALIMYSVIFDKQLIDTGLVGAIIRGFTEIIRGTASF